MTVMTLEAEISRRLDRLRAVAPAGYAIALHVRFTTPSYLFQTYPAPWIEEYAREGLVLRDPTVAWAFSNDGTVTWAALVAADPAGVIGRAARHGLVHGLSVSLLRGDSRSMASFARSDRSFEPEEIDEIERTMAEMHDATAFDLDSSALRRMSAGLPSG
ncbi:autoinducer binding domain-containing protein [Rubellimicrobium roseum]|nr:autoinducer binding domain-containing protein [Rubellimicrobium roseum]